MSDKITAFRKFEQGHKGLSEAAKQGTSPGIDPIVGTVKAFELNRLIHEELDHYAEFGEVLGKHPKLLNLKLEQEVSKLTPMKALKRRNTLRANISRDTKKLGKMKAGEAKEKFAERLERHRLEKELIERKFDL